MSSLFKFVVFANDTNIISSHKDFDFLVSKTNCELCKITDYFDANRLIMNYDKTYIM